jgi:hypothetical protein
MVEVSHAKKHVDALKPKRKPGARPKVTACPFCGASMSQTAHKAHRPGCRAAHRDAPPQARQQA